MDYVESYRAPVFLLVPLRSVPQWKTMLEVPRLAYLASVRLSSQSCNRCFASCNKTSRNVGMPSALAQMVQKASKQVQQSLLIQTTSTCCHDAATCVPEKILNLKPTTFGTLLPLPVAQGAKFNCTCLLNILHLCTSLKCTQSSQAWQHQQSCFEQRSPRSHKIHRKPGHRSSHLLFI